MRQMSDRVFPAPAVAAAAILCVVAAFVACGDSDPTGPPQLPPLPQFDGRFTFVDTMTVDRRERTALVVLPSGYDHETRIPILFG